MIKKLSLPSIILFFCLIPISTALTTYSCIDSNTLRRTENFTIIIDNSTEEIVKIRDVYCQSGCSGTGCTWGENWIFYFMASILVLYAIGHLVKSPQVMVTASIFGMTFTSIAIRFGFYIGTNYFYGTFIRLITITVFLTFAGLLIWCLNLGKQEEEEGEDIGRRS